MVPDKRLALTFELSNGNVWEPYIKSYQPINQSDRDYISQYVWHEREYYFNQLSPPSKTMEFQADGIIRTYRLNINIPLKGNQQLKIGSRMFSLDPGNTPYSLLTSDQFIEWFHTHVKGGNDPFARKIYGYDKAKIRYTDINGKQMQVDNGDFLFSGLEFTYTWFPQLKPLIRHKVFTNVSLQLGTNLTKVNPSVDLGLNTTLIKKFSLPFRFEVNIGSSMGALRQH